MKAQVFIRWKADVLDPQGRAVCRALSDIGVPGVRDVRIGKLVEVELDEEDPERARATLTRAAVELLANPVIEDFEVIVEPR